MRATIPAMKPAALAVLVAGLVLGACAAGPDYRAPRFEMAPAFRNAPAVERTAPTIEAWWTAFDDPVLNRLEAEAMAQNLDIAAAVARVQQARAGARAAEAALLPVGQASVQGARQSASIANSNAVFAALVPGYQRDASLYDVTAGASWELDLFGGLRREREAANADYVAAVVGAGGARLMVAADLADHYLQLRGLQARLGVASEAEAAAARLLRLVRLRVDAGEAPRRDRDGAEANLAQARATETQLRLAIEAELNAIALLLGRTAEADRGELETAAALPAPPALPRTAPGDLLRRRPDLVAAERRLAAANARIGAAISDYYPKVSLQGLIGYEATRTSRLFTGAALEQQGALGVKWRLFDFGRVDAEVAAARGRDAEALAVYRQAVLRATGDVENALEAREAQSARAAALADAADALTRQRRAAEDAYAAGQVSLLEVLDAERQRLAAQDQALAAKSDALRAAVALHRAIGG